jgi:murein DD-endopeptidase MepM/ murein hydrolase activator NlpD
MAERTDDLRQAPASAASPLLRGWRLPLVLALYALVSAAALGAVAVHVVERRVAERDGRLNDTLRELERREIARLSLEGSVTSLRDELAAQHTRVSRAEADNDRLRAALDQALAERAALEDERNLARERAQALDRGAMDTGLRLETAERERLAMARERAALEARLSETVAAFEEVSRREAALRWRLQNIEADLARLEDEQAATGRWLTDWLDERIGVLETLLEQAGIEPERRMAGTRPEDGAGQGGPLLPLDPAFSAAMPQPGYGVPATRGPGRTLRSSLAGELERLATVERLLAAAPLAAPLDHYYLTSGFGARIDPITRRRARHNGLDFGAAAGSEVVATAPGRVTRAGRMGSYGIMVEIDHGHGITTRYAHLSRTLVDAGDHVAPRAPVGIIGSTGRSTGRHLHYEVHLDGRPVDPARFIAAGRRLLGLLGS